MPENILFLSQFKKGQKWPNHFNSGKQFLKNQLLADLAFKKAKWQPWVCITAASVN
jgi:hypothetical protein